jgi:dynein heavy chain
MKGTGPAHIFIYYQKPYKVLDSGEIVENPGSTDQFFVTDGKLYFSKFKYGRQTQPSLFILYSNLLLLGEKEKLKGKGVYFLRCTVPAGKPITASGTNDNEVLFGEINEHTVYSLNTIVNNVYKPLVDKLDNNDWGACEAEQKKEFMQTFDRFAKEV